MLHFHDWSGIWTCWSSEWGDTLETLERTTSNKTPLNKFYCQYPSVFSFSSTQLLCQCRLKVELKSPWGLNPGIRVTFWPACTGVGNWSTSTVGLGDYTVFSVSSSRVVVLRHLCVFFASVQILPPCLQTNKDILYVAFSSLLLRLLLFHARAPSILGRQPKSPLKSLPRLKLNHVACCVF